MSEWVPGDPLYANPNGTGYFDYDRDEWVPDEPGFMPGESSDYTDRILNVYDDYMEGVEPQYYQSLSSQVRFSLNDPDMEWTYKRWGILPNDPDLTVKPYAWL